MNFRVCKIVKWYIVIRNGPSAGFHIIVVIRMYLIIFKKCIRII